MNGRINKTTYQVDGFERRGRDKKTENNAVIVISDDEDEPPTHTNPYMQFDEKDLVIKRERLASELKALERQESDELTGLTQQNLENHQKFTPKEVQQSNTNRIQPHREYTVSPTSDSGITEINDSDSDYSLDLALPPYNKQNVIRAEKRNATRTFEGVLARNETKRFAQNNTSVNHNQPISKSNTNLKTTSSQLSTNVFNSTVVETAASSNASVLIDHKQINDEPRNARSKSNSTTQKRRVSDQSTDSNIENTNKRSKQTEPKESTSISTKKNNSSEASTSTASNLLVYKKEDNLIDVSDCESISSVETIAIQEYFEHSQLPECEPLSSSEDQEQSHHSRISGCESISGSEDIADQKQFKISRVSNCESISSPEFSRLQIEQPGE